MINTKQVTGRRQLRYESLDDLLSDAQRCATPDVRCLGNWSAAQIFEHLARSMNASIDGFNFAFPAPVRWLMALLMKKKMLTQTIPAGYPSKPAFVADDSMTNEAALANLAAAIERQQQESERVVHPGFGNLTRDEWTAFHLRHAEMHMSFLQPAD